MTERLWGPKLLTSPIHFLDQVHNVHPASRADETIKVWYCLGEFVGAALRVASGGDDLLSRSLDLCQFPQHGTRFLPRRLNESASVNNQ
jgi:hypothetical protein